LGGLVGNDFTRDFSGVIQYADELQWLNTRNFHVLKKGKNLSFVLRDPLDMTVGRDVTHLDDRTSAGRKVSGGGNS